VRSSVGSLRAVLGPPPALVNTVRHLLWLLCALLIPTTAAAQRADRHPCFLYAQTLREVERATPDEIRERLRYVYVAARADKTLDPASANLLKAASAKRGIAEAGRQMVEACRSVGNWTFGEARSVTGAPVTETDALRQLKSALERQDGN
jgi:hypothetical protein